MLHHDTKTVAIVAAVIVGSIAIEIFGLDATAIGAGITVIGGAAIGLLAL